MPFGLMGGLGAMAGGAGGLGALGALLPTAGLVGSSILGQGNRKSQDLGNILGTLSLAPSIFQNLQGQGEPQQNQQATTHADFIMKRKQPMQLTQPGIPQEMGGFFNPFGSA